MSIVEDSIKYLGYRGLDKNGNYYENYWYDIQRIELEPNRVMDFPDFIAKPDIKPTKYSSGLAEKPQPKL